MATDYNNLTAGLNLTTQIPLNVKEFSINEATLAYLGVNNNLAYTYHDLLEVTCLEEKTTWIWREVQSGEENTGLVTLDFTYPTLPEVYGIDYSGKTYNFFQVYSNSIESIALISTVGLVKTYRITYTNGGSFDFVVTDGAPGVVNNLQRIITGSITLTNSDNNYTIIVNNGTSPINITVPSGLSSNFFVGIHQKGTGNVTLVESSTTINNPTGKKIKGQYYNVGLEQIGTTNEFLLGGDTKV